MCQRSIFNGLTKYGDHLSHSPGYEIDQFLASGFGLLVPNLGDLLVKFIPISALGVLLLSFDNCLEVFNERQVW